jgi:hypothetical protein
MEIELQYQTYKYACMDYEQTDVYIEYLIGGGIPETRRASEHTELLGVKIIPSQV